MDQLAKVGRVDKIFCGVVSTRTARDSGAPRVAEDVLGLSWGHSSPVASRSRSAVRLTSGCKHHIWKAPRLHTHIGIVKVCKHGDGWQHIQQEELVDIP